MLYDEYKVCIVRIALNQAACQGLDYVGRVKATDNDFLKLGYYARVDYRVSGLERAVEEIKNKESGRRKKKMDHGELINKLIIATIKLIE